MSWRKYSYWPRRGLPTRSHPLERPEWVLRGCYWRWLIYEAPVTTDTEDDIEYLERLKGLLQERVRFVDERLNALKKVRNER